MTVERYTPDLAGEWNKVVEESRNGIFLHRREYMDYHSDRFEDFSLIACDNRGRIVAVLPAHVRDSVLCSHCGLTFGGWLMTARADQPAMCEIWRLTLDLARRSGFTAMIYKPVPHIYHRSPAEEDIFPLLESGARLVAAMPASVADLHSGASFDMSARQSVRKALKEGVTVQESMRWEEYWQILSERLSERYDVAPVHSLHEIQLLKGRFPNNIRLFTAEKDGRILAGVVMYVSYGSAAHSQYTASTDEGRCLRVIPLLYSYISDILRHEVRYLDYGTSCENGGHSLNEGLIRQKCGFGARTVVYQTFELTI